VRRAIYPGTFDPITNGHLNIIKRGLHIFDEVIVGVADSSEKKPMFTLEERVEMIESSTNELQGVSVKPFRGLLVDFAKNNSVKTIIRGLRSNADFEYELQLSYANRSLYREMETVYLMPEIESSFISSSIVRSILKHSGSINHLVPSKVVEFVNR
jgi:pantetheine-phosphate adenylyltransferase